MINGDPVVDTQEIRLFNPKSTPKYCDLSKSSILLQDVV